MAPPAELGSCPGRFTRLRRNSPPCTVTSADRSTMAPPVLAEELSRNEQLTNVALEPSSTPTAPPAVDVAAARLPTNAQSWNSAWPFDKVTPPEPTTSAVKPFWKVIPSKTTSLPVFEVMRTRLLLPPPSRATAAPAAARMVKLLRAFPFLIAKPLGGVG